MSIPVLLSQLHSRRRFLALGALAGTATALAACGSAAPVASVAAAASEPAAPAKAAAAPAAAAQPATLYLSIVTGKMIGKKDYPAYIPADFSVPANSLVDVVVTNFDDATPLGPGMERYAKVTGTVGNTISIQPLTASTPNDAGQAKTVSTLVPKDVSHTLTFSDLGINVPMAPMSRISFRMKTGAPGVHSWQCFDPCGAGSNGWMGGMHVPGYMQGKMTVA
ncbi:MAG: hypothetical protein ACYDAG_00260 [Chloroflexota bacterium]